MGDGSGIRRPRATAAVVSATAATGHDQLFQSRRDALSGQAGEPGWDSAGEPHPGSEYGSEAASRGSADQTSVGQQFHQTLRQGLYRAGGRAAAGGDDQRSGAVQGLPTQGGRPAGRTGLAANAAGYRRSAPPGRSLAKSPGPLLRRAGQRRRQRHPGGTAGPAHGADPVESNPGEDRKSTRLNSSHLGISYAVFCLKKKKKTE